MPSHSLLFRNILMSVCFLCVLLLRAAEIPVACQKWNDLPSHELLKKGRMYVEKEKVDSALVCFTLLGRRYSAATNDKEREMCAKAMNNSGCIYYYKYYDFPQAYEQFIKALDICEKFRLESTLPIVYVNLGNLFNEYGRRYFSEVISQKAMEMYKKCFDFSYKSKNWKSLAGAFVNMSELNYNMSVDDYRNLFAKDVPDTLPDIKYARLQYLAIKNIGNKQYHKARAYFFRQLNLMNSGWESDRYVLSTYIGISYVYRLEKRYEEAIDYLKKAERLAHLHRAIDMEVQIYKMLSEVYRLQGNPEQSRHYNIVYLESKDSVMNINRLGTIGEMELIHDLKKEEEKVLELAMKRKIQSYIIGMAGLLIGLIAVFLIVVVKKNRQLGARNKSLFQKYQELMVVEEEERMLRKSYEDRLNKRETDEKSTEKYSKSRLNEEDKEQLIYRIEETMNTTEIICQSDFTISKLAKEVDSNTSYVSQVINEKYGMTFSILVGSYRVREACRRMNDQANYGNVTIEAISESVGFKSRVTFLNSFKRTVGLTPSEYLRIARQQ